MEKPPVPQPTHIYPAGYGYDNREGNFRRVTVDTPVSLAEKEHAKPQHVIVYDSNGERMHVTRRYLRPIA